MSMLSRLFLAGARNLVPATGWFLGGWAASTALVVFWFENLILTVLIGVRILVHRRQTRTRGHEGGFLARFLTPALFITIAQAFFLAFVLGAVLDAPLDRAEIVTGLQWLLAAHILSLTFDLFSIGDWPFSEIRGRVDWVLGRVVVVQFCIIGGMFLFAAMDEPAWFFSLFVAIKVVMDLASLLPQWKPTADPPAALVWLTGLFPPQKGKGSFQDHWRRERAAELARQASDEEVLPGA